MTDAIFIDGSALANAMPPRTSKTFADYTEMEFIPQVDACTKDTIEQTLCSIRTRSQASNPKRGLGGRHWVIGTGK